MLPRLVLILIIVGAVYYASKYLKSATRFIKCQKCDGKGYWIAMRGEKERCDICKGGGRINRRL